MKRPLFVLFLIVLLIGAGLTGIYRGKSEYAAASQQHSIPAPQNDTPAPAPVEQPSPPVEPTPAPTPIEQPPAPAPRPQERPHSREHATVLQVAQAMQTESSQHQEKAWQNLVDAGKVSPEAAATLREWAKDHPEFKVEEIGTVITENSGEKETRYRLVSATGGDDVLVSVKSPAKAAPTIADVKKTSSDRTAVTTESDAITVVEGFVEALKRGDMPTARRLTTGQDISDATLAGLCMMFEEGDFNLRKKLPIRNMFRNGENSGFIIYMAPQDGSAQSHSVGLEMVYAPEQGWVVKAVALDDLLMRYESKGEAEGGVYFPIVKNPQGGDSLVLFFGFNDASLSPRSQSQLRIVSNILRESKGALTISGHTDDIGSSAYNKELSLRRADAVKAALISYGVEADKIHTHGLGESQPRRIYKADDTVQTIRSIRSENRRAEIYLDF